MGTTAQKLSYLNETKTKLKDKINLMGANITDDTFRSYPDKIKDGLLDIMNNGYEKVWNNWDKVTGSGTEITLNNTEEAPMKIDYKGNTSQDTTTGKQLLNYSEFGYQQYITFGEEYITITNNSGATIYPAINFSTPLDAGGYTTRIEIKSITAGKVCTLYVMDDVNIYTAPHNIIQAMSTNTTYVANKTFTDTIKRYMLVVQDGTTIKLSVMLVKGIYTTDNIGSWEPYTGGKASPNPDYPQEVKVVKGDNVLKVEGKNLFNKNATPLYTGLYQNTTNGAYVTANDFSVFKINLDANTNYVITSYGQSNAPGIVFYNSNDEYISGISFSNRRTIPITTPANISYAQVSVVTKEDSYRYELDIFQIEKGTTATSYLPYQAEEHTISLGVENLIDSKITSQTLNGVQFSVNEDKSIYISGTATARTEPKLWTNASGTLTLKANVTYYNNSNTTLYLYDGSYRTIVEGGSYTPTEDKSVTQIYIRVENGETIDKTIYPMLSTKQSSTYYQYGKNIELCKINTYQDKIIGNDGSNLVDFGTQSFTTYKDYTGLNLPAGTYTFSSKITSSDTSLNVSRVYFYGANGGTEQGFINLNRNTRTSATITTTFDIVRIVLYSSIDYSTSNGKTATYEDIMLNKGTTALEYQPYGSGEYYKKEEVGGIVLDGTENTWNIGQNGQNLNYYYIAIADKPFGYGNILSNKFVSFGSSLWNISTYQDLMSGASANSTVNFLLSDSSIDTKAKFLTWLANNNIKVYYGKLTTEYIKITNNTLIKQLDAIKKSKASQTNISQENDGFPFELDVSALEDLT